MLTFRRHHKATSLGFYSGRGLLALFAVTILLPGLLLCAFSVRGLLQERRLAGQQVREQLERIATETSRSLEFELHRWKQLLDEVRFDTAGVPTLPAPLGAALSKHEGAVVLAVSGRGRHVIPEGRFLYDPGAATPDSPSSVHAEIASAETLELLQEDYGKAIRAYEALLPAASPSWRPLLLHRLARTLRKAGRLTEALRRFHELEAFPQARIGQVPADLAARFEACAILTAQGEQAGSRTALALYTDLVNGRWRLEKSRYSYYAESARDWAASSPDLAAKAASIRLLEQKKEVFTEAVSEAAAQTRRAVPSKAGGFLSFWRETSSGRVLLLLSPEFQKAELWPRVVNASATPQFAVSLVAPGSQRILGNPVPENAEMTAFQTAADGEFSWQVRVWANDPGALYRQALQRQRLYLALLFLVVALLVFGGFFTVRAARREAAVARLKADFVSAVSHEFRSPLTGIRQLAEMLERGRVPGEERRLHYYSLIRRECDRLARLVENLLDFASMEDGRKQYRSEPIDTSAWLTTLLGQFQGELNGRQVAVETRLPAVLPALRGDHDALSAAVLNLLDNAVKYSPEPATVWFEAECSGNSLNIRVRDHGIGITKEDRPHVFEKFFRGSGGGATSAKGAGIGLALVRHIVTSHGGRVECQSHLGEGSTFTIQLPIISEYRDKVPHSDSLSHRESDAEGRVRGQLGLAPKSETNG